MLLKYIYFLNDDLKKDVAQVKNDVYNKIADSTDSVYRNSVIFLDATSVLHRWIIFFFSFFCVKCNFEHGNY